MNRERAFLKKLIFLGADSIGIAHQVLLQMLVRLCSVLLLFLLVETAPAFAQSAELNTYHRYVLSGFQQLKTGDYRSARDNFEEALHYRQDDAAVFVGLGAVYFHLKDDRAAERALNQALERNPKEKTAYQILGDLAHRKDDLAEAVKAWERALEIDSTDAALKAKLDRIRKEHHAEKDFNRDVTSHFSIKYEGRERIEAGRIALRILEDAYGEIGRALSFYPDQEIGVILYSDKQFQEVTDAPGWSGGIYDGKIRIPIGGIEQETPGLRRLLYHEYTHAVVRAITRHVPTWLNEGLAQHFEGRLVEGNNKIGLRGMAAAGKLPPLRALEGSFMGLNGPQAGVAYLISLSALRYMVDQFGMYRVKMVLEELASGADVPKAVDTALLVSYEDFERGWRRSLE